MGGAEAGGAQDPPPQGTTYHHAQRPTNGDMQAEVKPCIKSRNPGREEPQETAQGPTPTQKKLPGTNKGPTSKRRGQAAWAQV